MRVGAIARKDRLILLGTGWVGKVLPWMGALWLVLGVLAAVRLSMLGSGAMGTWPALGEFSAELYTILGTALLSLVLVLAPLVAVESTLLDLEEDRLQLLALTPIPAAGFVFDKVRVAVTAPGPFLFVTSWSLLPCVAAGGVPIAAALWMFLALVATAALAASVAVLVAVAARQALVARLATYLGIGMATVAGGSTLSAFNPLGAAFTHFLHPSRSLASWEERGTWLGVVAVGTLVAGIAATLVVRRALLRAAAGSGAGRSRHAHALLAVVAGAGVADLLLRGETGGWTAAVFCGALAWGAFAPILAARRARRAAASDDPVAWKDRQLYRSGSLQVVLGALFLGNVGLCAWWTSRGAGLRTPAQHVGWFLQVELVLLSIGALVLSSTAFAWERLRGTFDLVLLSGLAMDRIARSKARAVLLGVAPLWAFAVAWALASWVETRGAADPPSAIGILFAAALGIVPLWIAVWLGCAYGLAAKTMGEVAGSFGGSVWVFWQVGKWLVPFGTPNAFLAVVSPFWFPRSFAEGAEWSLSRMGSFLAWAAVWGFVMWITPRAVQGSARRLDPWGTMAKAKS